ncbi:MAG TPA: hypothetical protein VJP02_21390 [Candidatus Sulfotelmatobacter sp.]|nr:hypothetical protein [Candidatus Sulfotelmatobacter sp.]
MMEVQNPVQKIWQDQPVEGIKMSAEEIRRRAGKFERRIRRRNLRESVGCMIVSGLFAYFLYDTHNVLFRIAYGLFIVAMIWIAIQLHRKGFVTSLPAGLEASSSLQFFRTELERQRDAIRNVWPWYLAPLVPGYVMLTIAYAVSFPRPLRWIGAGAFDLFAVLMFLGIWKMNMRAARCLQRLIDELNAAE